MQEYFELTEYTLEKIWFDYLGKRYSGRGFMRWNPEEGFKIEAVLDKCDQLPMNRLEFGKIRIIRDNDKSSIKMKPQGFNWAIAPNITLFERDDIVFHNRLSICIARVVFCKLNYSNLDNFPAWLGSSLYETNQATLVFPIVYIKKKQSTIRL